MSSFTTLLISLCNIQDQVLSTTGYEKIKTWSDISTDNPCRKDANTSTSIVDGQIRTSIDDDIFFFNPDVVINRGNRIVFNGDNYDVIKVNKCYDSVGIHHIEVLARIVDHK